MATLRTLRIWERGFLDSLVLVALMLFSWPQLQYYIVPDFQHVFSLIIHRSVIDANQAASIWPPLVAYALAALMVWAIISVFHEMDGEKNLPEHWLEGAIVGTMVGLALGFVGGLIVWIGGHIGTPKWAPVSVADALVGGMVVGNHISLLFFFIGDTIMILRYEFWDNSG